MSHRVSSQLMSSIPSCRPPHISQQTQLFSQQTTATHHQADVMEQLRKSITKVQSNLTVGKLTVVSSIWKKHWLLFIFVLWYKPLARVCSLGTSPPRTLHCPRSERAACGRGGRGTGTSRLVGKQKAQNCFQKLMN